MNKGGPSSVFAESKSDVPRTRAEKAIDARASMFRTPAVSS